jgi:ribosomal protein L37AE/L43A
MEGTKSGDMKMGEEKDIDLVIEECCNVVSWHSNIFKIEIDASKEKEIALDMSDISKLTLPHYRIERFSEKICLKLKDMLKDKGIDVSIDEYGNGEKFVILKREKISVGRLETIETSIIGEGENFLDILKDNKLYYKDTKKLLCPKCHRYSVTYSISTCKEYDKIWWCDNCIKIVNYINYNIYLDDKDKYQIYKLFGVEALNMLTKESMRKTISFISSYFKSGCIAKKDKCLYFDFFK